MRSGVTRGERRARFVASLRTLSARSRGAVRTAIHVHIDDLVLHGFAPRHGRSIGDNTASELARLFATHGVPGPMLAMRDAKRLDAGVIDAAPAAPRSSVGRRIAGAVYAVRQS
jgi:hypothetical protein